MIPTPVIVSTSQAYPMSACPFVTNAYLTFVETALNDLNLTTFIIWTGTETRQASMEEALKNIAYLIERPELQPTASTINKMIEGATSVALVMDEGKAAQGVLPEQVKVWTNLWLPQLPGWLERLAM